MKLTEKYSIKRDKYQWVLEELREGFNPKTKEPTLTPRLTYHSNLQAILKYCLEIEGGNCESIEELITLLTKAHKMIESLVPSTKQIKQMMKET